MGEREITGSVTATADAPPDAVFDALVDVARLATWNDRIEALETPVGELAVGATWTVRMRLPGKRFSSTSEVLELDHARRRFVHRSKPDDDNPSHTVWTWDVLDAGDGRSDVTVSWAMRPHTLDRRIAAAIRKRMIPSEVAASIGRLAGVCEERDGARD